MLCLSFLDYDVVFSTAERPTRPVYVTIEGEYFLTMAMLFHDGHLQAGGYQQIQWDQYLLIKWET
jgi:hypothetical protein